MPESSVSTPLLRCKSRLTPSWSSVSKTRDGGVHGPVREGAVFTVTPGPEPYRKYVPFADWISAGSCMKHSPVHGSGSSICARTPETGSTNDDRKRIMSNIQEIGSSHLRSIELSLLCPFSVNRN